MSEKTKTARGPPILAPPQPKPVKVTPEERIQIIRAALQEFGMELRLSLLNANKGISDYKH